MKNTKEHPKKAADILSEYRSHFLFFVRQKSVLWPLILVLLLSYAFAVLHPSFSNDDTAMDRYFDGSEILLQTRIFPYFLNKILNLYHFQPVIIDLLAVIFFAAAALLFCSLLKKIMEKQLTGAGAAIFCCVMVSYPLIHEIFVYMQVSFTIGIGYFLTVLSILCMYEYLREKHRGFLVASVALLLCSVLSFESFLTVFLVGIFCVLLADTLFSEKPLYSKLKEAWPALLKILLVCAAVFAVRMVLSAVLPLILPDLFMQSKNPSTNSIAWDFSRFPSMFLRLIGVLVFQFGLHALSYLPLTIFFLSSLLMVFGGVIGGIRKKSIWIVLLSLFAFGSNFALSFVQGIPQQYRVCQSFALFCAFVFLLVYQWTERHFQKKWMKYGCAALLSLLIFHQCQDLNGWFHLDNLRYQYEEQVLYEVGFQLEKEYPVQEKPVIFTGKPDLPAIVEEKRHIPDRGLERDIMNFFHYDTKMPMVQTSLNSVIEWGISAFDEPNTELFKLFDFLGFHFIPADQALYDQVKSVPESTPRWPEKGSITEYDTYILVHF